MLFARELTERAIGLAIEVHRLTGPGMLESVYEGCLRHELEQAGVAFEQGRPIRRSPTCARKTCSRSAPSVAANPPRKAISAKSTTRSTSAAGH
jgi:PD-(D/E)XK nuclease superfamily protein